MSLSLPVQYLKNVGPSRAKIFHRLEINTILDLLFYFPRRHIDRSTIKKLAAAAPGEKDTLLGTVKFVEELRPRSHMVIFKAILQDSSGYISAVWFNNKYISKTIVPGVEVIVTGKVEQRFGKVEISVSEYEVFDSESSESVNFGRVVPVYQGLADKFPQKTFRSLLHHAFELYGYLITEIIPEDILIRQNLEPRRKAIFAMHFPDNAEGFEKARRTMAFEELFILQLALQYGRSKQQEKSGTVHYIDYSIREKFLGFLPFDLTNAQKRVLAEIDADMSSTRPMARLLQGDVGSGKTVLAQLAMLSAIASRSQAAIMAPTEILAEQHYLGLKPLFEKLGYTCAFLRGGMRKKERQDILTGIAQGSIHVVVGTHAVIQKDIIFQKLGLVVIDEQHRFGVKQRVALELKGLHPDLFVMTATPIPRTLAMTLYSDLEVSVIDELPPGRKPIKTYQVDFNMMPRIHKFLLKEVTGGRQCYYVCPLVEESEKIDLEAVTKVFAELCAEFPQLQIGLMHGKLSQKEKEAVMTTFRDGQIQVLVATTVVEVGVDVPNASLMIIKDAERFGLAQLHQLRGRIGRGKYQSYCVLLADPKTAEAKQRMQVMVTSNDGFFIAEEDLKIRGPGEFLGTRQHGISEIKIANLVRDVDIMSFARKEAQEYLHKSQNCISKELMEVLNTKYFSLA